MMSSSSSCDALSTFGHVGQRHGVADAGHHVLALGVLEVVAVHALVAGGGVAGEADARARGHAAVAEDHGLDVDGGAEVLGDLLLAAVEDGAVGVPRVEDGTDGAVHLLARVLGELDAGVLADDALERLDQGPQVLDVEVEVVGDALGVLGRVEGVGEVLAVDAQHGAAEHLQQAAVGVHREPLVLALPGEAGHRGVVEPDVEDGLHHPGHGELGPRPDADQQRVVGVAEPAAHRLLERGEVRGHLVGEAVGLGAVLEVGPAGLRGDGEARRDGEPEVAHLGEVGPLAPEQVLLVAVTVGEVVHPSVHLRHLAPPAPDWAVPTRHKSPKRGAVPWRRRQRPDSV